MTLNNIESLHYAVSASGNELTVIYPSDTDIDAIKQSDMSVCTIRTNTGDKVMDLEGYRYLLSIITNESEIFAVWGKNEIPLDELRAAKKREIGEACSAVIYAGVEVGGRRYSLTEHDQIELLAQQAAVKEGAAFVPYHADGELCRIYTAEEFMPVADAANYWILLNRTKCNHFNQWIARAEGEELENITYDSELPEDLQEHMDELLAHMGADGR